MRNGVVVNALSGEGTLSVGRRRGEVSRNYTGPNVHKSCRAAPLNHISGIAALNLAGLHASVTLST